jgi:colanic acid biosynthesis glycosyl transferase WcaI
MQILIITPNYNPDLGPSAPLFTMLSHGLVQRGHEVKVISAVPHYPTGIVPVEFRGKWIRNSIENGVKVTRVALPSVERRSLAKRFYQFACFQIGATIAGLSQRYDVVIVANPALQVWLPFAWMVALRRKPAIFSVHDVYPDVGITLGVFRNKAQIAFVAGLEKFCLTHATFVRILSDSFRPGLMRLNVPESKIALIYDWVDTALIKPEASTNNFSKENGFDRYFIVMYAGNIGLSQGLDNIVSAAKILSDQTDIKFIFVGDGIGKETLQAQVKNLQLENIHFLPFQPRERLPEVLSSADISIVILKKGIGTASLPSKIFSIMASGKPILISVEENSEAWELIRNADAGVWSPPEDPVALAQTILTLKKEDSKRKRLGKNGRLWAERHHSPEVAAEQFEKLLVSAINQHQ